MEGTFRWFRLDCQENSDRASLLHFFDTVFFWHGLHWLHGLLNNARQINLWGRPCIYASRLNRNQNGLNWINFLHRYPFWIPSPTHYRFRMLCVTIFPYRDCFRTITYRLVTPTILFFCIAETCAALKRCVDMGACMMWLWCQPVLFSMVQETFEKQPI